MIKLYDNWVINTDAYQYILGREVMRVDKKTDETVIEIDDRTFHRTLAQALTAFHAKELRQFVGVGEVTLQAAINASQAIEDRIRGMIINPDFKDFKEPQKSLEMAGGGCFADEDTDVCDIDFDSIPDGEDQGEE